MATHSSFLPGESYGLRGLAGYSLEDRKESDPTEATEHIKTLRDGEGQGSLACCSSRGHKEADTTW